MNIQNTVIFIIGFLIVITAMFIVLIGAIGILLVTIDYVFEVDTLYQIKTLKAKMKKNKIEKKRKLYQYKRKGKKI